MKAILEFTLPEENHEHQDALQGSEWKWALTEVADYLRNQIKHADNSAEEYRTFERVRDRLTEILDDRGLNLYE
jgi:hypothetical protein